MELLTRATHLLEENTQHHERDGQSYRFSCPSAGHYPFQWLWDSCFHAFVWAKTDPERAADELRSLLLWQRADGFVPHVVFWRQDKLNPFSWHYLESEGTLGDWARRRPPQTSALSQPPVLAPALEAVVGAAGDQGDAILRELLPAVASCYRYFARERDPQGLGLIANLCQFESGIDYSPAYDRAIGMRHPNPASLFLRSRAIQLKHKRAGYDPKSVFAGGDYAIDPLMNAVYGQGLAALARLATRVDDHALSAWARAGAARVTEALLEHSYDERLGLFLVLYGQERRRQEVRSVQGLMPLILEDLPRDVVSRLCEQLEDPRHFGTTYPVPSVALSEPTFRRDVKLMGVRFIWRGPCSMNTNWLLAGGLEMHGHTDLAAGIGTASREMALRGGFSEFYDPIDGRALGIHRFGWATLAALI
jgi:hypothetical protein